MCKLISNVLYLEHCQYCVNHSTCIEDEDYLVCDVWNIDMYGEPDECLPPKEAELDAHAYMDLYGE